MSQQAAIPEPRSIVLSEGRVISKYTVVPIGLVIAAIAGTFAFCNYLYADKAKMAVLEAKTGTLQTQFDQYKTANDLKMVTLATTLNRIDKNVAVIAAGLDVAIDGQ